MSFANEQEQVLIKEHQGRVVSITSNIPRPIQECEKEINHLKMQLAAKETELKQKEAEIQECNEILTNNHKAQNVLLDTIEMQYKKIQELRGTRDEN